MRVVCSKDMYVGYKDFQKITYADIQGSQGVVHNKLGYRVYMSLHYDGACQSFTFPFLVSAVSTHTLTTDRKQELAK